MTRTLLPLLLLVAACTSTNNRNVAARQGEATEVASPLSVHPSIDESIEYVRHTTDRTPDGRMQISVVMASASEGDLILVAHTDWYDAQGYVVERSASRPIVIPPGQTYVWGDSSYNPSATRFGVSVRPATTKRLEE